MLVYVIIFGILLELIILVGGVYLVLKYLSKLKSPSAPIEVKISGKNITSEVVRDGFKDAIKELEFEKEQEKLIMEKARNPETIFNAAWKDEPVTKSGGNLVPYNLTTSERAVLEMFYGDE